MKLNLYPVNEVARSLTSMQQVTEQALKNAPDGTLKIDISSGKPKYYQRTGGKNPRLIYIPVNEIEKACALAQKDYDQKLLKLLKRKLRRLNSFLKYYPVEEIDAVYNFLSPERQALVRPIVPTDLQFIKEWENEPYDKLPFRADDRSAYYTEKGERVRSKSEVIIANALFRAGIPYKYECPLILSGRTVYPDFTILDIRTRTVIYFEHFGMMDDPEYRRKAMQKIALYAANGIVQGKNLLYTMEFSDQALDTRYLKALIHENLKTAGMSALI